MFLVVGNDRRGGCTVSLRVTDVALFGQLPGIPEGLQVFSVSLVGPMFWMCMKFSCHKNADFPPPRYNFFILAHVACYSIELVCLSSAPSLVNCDTRSTNSTNLDSFGHLLIFYDISSSYTRISLKGIATTYVPDFFSNC